MPYPSKNEENRLHKKGIKYIAGLDEAGRGALAGPIVGAAVILKKGTAIKGVKDSKQLSPVQRERMLPRIKKEALAWSVFQVGNLEIDEKGIQKANHKVLTGAAKKLKTKPHFLLVDALKINIDIPSKSIVKGDEKIFSIACASIIAKVSRDRIMKKWHRKYPRYLFHKHKGYGTKEHVAAIRKYGLTDIHRRTFTSHL